MRLLLIEDDDSLAAGMLTALTHFQYTVDHVCEGESALNAIAEVPYSLVILDLGLPGMDGIDLLKKLRQTGKDIPVLILTARDHLDDKIEGLNSGADDYMVKPFDLKELEARIRTLTRRSQGRRTDVLEVGCARLNIQQRLLSLRGDQISFSRREFSLIQAFFEQPRRVYTREILENLIYNWHEEIESNALEVHVHRLRKKLGNKAIKNVRGVGYMLVPEELE